MELKAGVVVAQHYRIQHRLGRGGMGEVFAAENTRTGRVVAVKVLHSHSKMKASAVERFRREARAAGAINSDHVTQVLDVEDDSEHGIVLVFEMLEGESLLERLQRTGPMTFDELWPVMEEVWVGLEAAHEAGIIHRDLKPSNVFLERRPGAQTRAKVLDFGISKLPNEIVGEALTQSGQSLGTFSFMPPEQIGNARTVDHRADIYACATLIYQAMSGHLPYEARDMIHLVELKTSRDPRPLSAVLDGPIDPRLEEFLQCAFARDPEKRFRTAADALAAWRSLKVPPQGVAIADPGNPELPRSPAGLVGAGGMQLLYTPPPKVEGTADTAAGEPVRRPAASGTDASQPGQNSDGFGSTIVIPPAHGGIRERGADETVTVPLPKRKVQQAFASVAQRDQDRGTAGTRPIRNVAVRAVAGSQAHEEPRPSQAPLGESRALHGPERSDGSIPPPRSQQPTGGEAAPNSRRVWLVIGFGCFALISFAITALVIHYLHSGKLWWH